AGSGWFCRAWTQISMAFSFSPDSAFSLPISKTECGASSESGKRARRAAYVREAPRRMHRLHVQPLGLQIEGIVHEGAGGEALGQLARLQHALLVVLELEVQLG